MCWGREGGGRAGPYVKMKALVSDFAWHSACYLGSRELLVHEFWLNKNRSSCISCWKNMCILFLCCILPSHDSGSSYIFNQKLGWRWKRYWKQCFHWNKLWWRMGICYNGDMLINVSTRKKPRLEEVFPVSGDLL